ncbi:MAG: alpha/beta fold hydrolase [Candidatus Zixiibacteriota bacterium]
MKKDIVFAASDGERLRSTIFGQDNLGKGPCIVFVHGFKGFKDWGFWPYMGNYFADRGYIVVSFNFSHNGVGESLTEFDELDRFSENTFSREVREVCEIVDACRSGFFGDIGDHRIALLGHSRGGGISLAAARQKPEVAAVALWSSVADFSRYSEKHKERWRKTGHFEVVNQRTGQVMRLNATLLEDLEEHKGDLLNIEKAVRELSRPLLIAHGEQDISVTVAEGEKLFECSDKNRTEFHIIPKTGHTFGIVHPFAGSSTALDSVLEKTESFYAKNLK